MFNVDETTCWYNKKLYHSVNKATKKEGELTNIQHGKVLKQLFEMVPLKETTILDIGCGNAKASTIIGNRKYTGLDLPNNIKTIAKINHPNLDFIAHDIIENNIDFIKDYDIILMNGFIDVLQYPLQILDKILKNCKKYIILHRQDIIEDKTKVITNSSYNGFTYHSEINKNDFNNILKKNHINIIKEVGAGVETWKVTEKQIHYLSEWKSFLLKI